MRKLEMHFQQFWKFLEMHFRKLEMHFQNPWKSMEMHFKIRTWKCIFFSRVNSMQSIENNGIYFYIPFLKPNSNIFTELSYRQP